MTSEWQVILFCAMMAIVATTVFEAAKASVRQAHERCWCGHVKQTVLRFGGHVRPMDYDSKAYIDGAEFNPGQCRECSCRAFHPQS